MDGLYVHIPFCFHKCHYCDFYSIVDSQDRQGAFTDALIRELGNWADRGELRPRSIFVGGGTPTLLASDHWRRLLSAMRDRGVLDAVEEFTVEANPETVTPELLAVLAEGGVNRLSIGAQSFHRDLLKTLERWHEPSSVEQAVAAAQSAGITDLNLDLIFAIPGQTQAMLDEDLAALLALKPTHLACYSLIFEPGTPLKQKQSLGRIEPMAEDTEAAMYRQVIDRLDEAGFEHYEISNWARRRPPANVKDEPTAVSAAEAMDYRCTHNLLYWQNANWLGIGPSAASHCEGRRWKNVAHLGQYLQHSPKPPLAEDETLGADERVGERLMLGLRMRDGVDRGWLDRTLTEADPRWQAIEQMRSMGLLALTETALKLTDRGLFVADRVIGELL
jgi:oxygen-independent coproporphyrinogen-3 oxidase